MAKEFVDGEREMDPARVMQLSRAARNILRGLGIDPKELKKGRGEEFNSPENPGIASSSHRTFKHKDKYIFISENRALGNNFIGDPETTVELHTMDARGGITETTKHAYGIKDEKGYILSERDRVFGAELLVERTATQLGPSGLTAKGREKTQDIASVYINMHGTDLVAKDAPIADDLAKSHQSIVAAFPQTDRRPVPKADRSQKDIPKTERKMDPADVMKLSSAALNILRGLGIKPEDLKDGKGMEYSTPEKPNAPSQFNRSFKYGDKEISIVEDRRGFKDNARTSVGIYTRGADGLAQNGVSHEYGVRDGKPYVVSQQGKNLYDNRQHIVERVATQLGPKGISATGVEATEKIATAYDAGYGWSDGTHNYPTIDDAKAISPGLTRDHKAIVNAFPNVERRPVPKVVKPPSGNP